MNKRFPRHFVPPAAIRRLQLAKYAKGGLGNVLEMDDDLFEMFYTAMFMLNDAERDAMKKEKS